MNLENIEFIRRFLQFSIHLLQQFWIRLSIVEPYKAYKKSKMAVTVQAAASPSVVGGSSSFCSSNCIMNGAFQETLGSNLRRFSLENLDCNSYTIGTDNSPLGSNPMPVRSPVAHKAQTASPSYDRNLAKHDNTGSSQTVGKDQDKWEKCAMETSRGMKYFNPPERITSPCTKWRPPKLEIPPSTTSTALSLQSMEFHEDMPNEIYIEGSNYAIACKKGRRKVMEDAYTVMTDVSGDPSQAFFGVFDGHGGRKAAEFAAENLGRNIVDKISELVENSSHMEEGVRSGYLTTDEAFSKQNSSGGSCCVTAMVKGGHLVVGNAGDCRAVLSIQGNAEALTSDHKIEREDERQRIEHLGGYVDCHNGVWRVQGLLAVSRSIGDIHMKQWISAEPEIKTLKISSDFEFLILASDGFWDKVGNQEAVDISRPFSVESSPKALAACRELVEIAVKRGSKDDITVMIVDLRNFCK